MKSIHRIAQTLITGSLAGLVHLAVDELAALFTLGYWVPVLYRHVAAYVVAGALGAGLVEGTLALRRRPAAGASRLIATTVAVLYAPPIFERIYQALDLHLALPLASAAAGVAVAGYAMWIALLGRIIAPQSPVTDPPAPAFALGALTVAVGLAVNRNLVTLPQEPAALAADAAIAAGALAGACLVRVVGSRRIMIAAGAIIALAAVAVSLAPWMESIRPADRSPAPRKPHLVLVLIDTLRLDAFQAVLAETQEGRAFQEAIRGSAWFNNAIAASPWTVPSIGSIMTGLYPQEHGFGGSFGKDRTRQIQRLADSVPTLAERLSANGYRSRAIVTNSLLHPASGIARGFDSFEVLGGATIKLPWLTVLARIGWLKRDPYQSATTVHRRLRQQVGKIAAGGQPVFLWLHFMDPHFPLRPHPGLGPDPAAAGLSQPRILYRDEIRYTLRELTAILALWRFHGLWENSAWILLSDHGEMFPADGHDNSLPTQEPILYGHGHALYGELIRVPLVIRPPGGLTADRQVDALVSHTDLFDTIGDLLDLDFPRIGGDRLSLVPWLEAELPAVPPPARSYTLASANQYGPRQRALCTRQLKLIVYPNGERPAELYEITSDPREQRNLAATRAGRLARTKRLYERSWAQLAEAPDTRPLEIDAETRARLKGLGYLQE